MAPGGERCGLGGRDGRRSGPLLVAGVAPGSARGPRRLPGAGQGRSRRRPTRSSPAPSRAAPEGAPGASAGASESRTGPRIGVARIGQEGDESDEDGRRPSGGEDGGRGFVLEERLREGGILSRRASGMAQDETSRPPDPGSTKRSVAEKLGVPPERIHKYSLNPWEWAAARGLKPLPGREIPPEYRHLFKDAAASATDGTAEPTEPALPPPIPFRPR